jgi:hypothetical protein
LLSGGLADHRRTSAEVKIKAKISYAGDCLFVHDTVTFSFIYQHVAQGTPRCKPQKTIQTPH